MGLRKKKKKNHRILCFLSETEGKRKKRKKRLWVFCLGLVQRIRLRKKPKVKLPGKIMRKDKTRKRPAPHP